MKNHDTAMMMGGNMLNKIIQSVKSVFKETPEEKSLRELQEATGKRQENIISNIKCPICEGKSFRKGYVASTGGHGGGGINMVSTYYEGYNIEYESKSLVCDICGYVILLADFKYQAKLTLTNELEDKSGKV